MIAMLRDCGSSGDGVERDKIDSAFLQSLEEIRLRAVGAVAVIDDMIATPSAAWQSEESLRRSPSFSTSSRI